MITMLVFSLALLVSAVSGWGIGLMVGQLNLAMRLSVAAAFMLLGFACCLGLLSLWKSQERNQS